MRKDHAYHERNPSVGHSATNGLLRSKLNPSIAHPGERPSLLAPYYVLSSTYATYLMLGRYTATFSLSALTLPCHLINPLTTKTFQKRALEETKAVLPNIQKRIESGIENLESQLVSHSHNFLKDPSPLHEHHKFLNPVKNTYTYIHIYIYIYIYI